MANPRGATRTISAWHRLTFSAWGKELAIDEFIVADSAVLARREAAEKWMLPEEMIAVSFVDGH